MILRFISCFLALFIFASPAIAAPPNLTITDFRNGSYPLWAVDGANFTFKLDPPIAANYSIPSGYKYSDTPVDKCLYPASNTYYARLSNISSSTPFLGSNGISHMVAAPQETYTFYVYSPCITGKVYLLVPDNGDVASCPLDTANGSSELDSNKPGFLAAAANSLVKILPQTPENMRLPTLIANMGGQGSLAGNLAYELYSACWQYFGVIAFIKFYKLIPGKMT